MSAPERLGSCHSCSVAAHVACLLVCLCLLFSWWTFHILGICNFLKSPLHPSASFLQLCTLPSQGTLPDLQGLPLKSKWKSLWPYNSYILYVWKTVTTWMLAVAQPSSPMIGVVSEYMNDRTRVNTCLGSPKWAGHSGILFSVFQRNLFFFTLVSGMRGVWTFLEGSTGIISIVLMQSTWLLFNAGLSAVMLSLAPTLHTLPFWPNCKIFHIFLLCFCYWFLLEIWLKAASRTHATSRVLNTLEISFTGSICPLHLNSTSYKASGHGQIVDEFILLEWNIHGY